MTRAWFGVASFVAGCLFAAACGSDDDDGKAGTGGAAGSGASAGSSTGGTKQGGAGGASAGSGGQMTAGSGGQATGGGGNYSADCAGLCQKTADAACPNADPIQVCIDECELSRLSPAYCAAQRDAYITCAVSPSATYACDPPPGEFALQGCDDAAWAAFKCTACVATDEDDGCEICSKHACCTEYTAATDAPNALDFVKCATPCSTQSCVSACESQYPSAAAAFDALDACRDTKCPGGCAAGGGPDAGPTSDAITNYCNALAGAGCSPATDSLTCQANHKMLTEYVDDEGCGLATYLTMQCSAAKTITCGDAGAMGDPSCLLMETCGPEICDSYWSPDGQCGTGCVGWFGSCAPADAGTGLSCTCDDGSAKGTHFDLSTGCGDVDTFFAITSKCK